MNENVAESAFRERLSNYSLSELEDVLAHVDRDAYPDREQLVVQEIESRLEGVKGFETESGEEAVAEESPGFARRFGLSLVDFSIQVMIPYIVLYFIVKVIYTPLGQNKWVQYLFPPAETQGAGRGRRGRGGGGNDIWSDITGAWDSLFGFVSGVVTAEPEAISTLITTAEYFVVYLVFRIVWTVWRLSKSGGTSGMQELGVVLVKSDGGAISAWLAAGRFVLHHALFICTLGVSGLWMFWDKEKKALHDRLLGTKLVRVARSWEKSADERKLD